MNKQQHINSLRLEIEENIDLLIAHCMAGHLDDSRLVAACLRGSRHKLNQLLRWDNNQVTQIDRRIPKRATKDYDIAASAIVCLMWGLAIVAVSAVGVWLYSVAKSI